MTDRHWKQRGVALVSAIFLLVVLVALGVYMVTVSGVQQAETSQSITAARVYFGARAGLEWGIHWAVAPGANAADPTLGLCNASTGPFSLTGPGFEGVNVTVTCSTTIYNGGDLIYIFNVTSTATYGSLGSPDYVERRLQAIACRTDSGSATQC